MTRIVTAKPPRTRRPSRRRKAVALAGPAIVTSTSKRATTEVPGKFAQNPATEQLRKKFCAASAITTSISRKRARLQRAEQPAEPEPDDDPEADALMRAWLARAKWGHGPGGSEP